ncbi:hypothetical protein M2281_003799 [Mesorhizobium soli]|uniref:hypothetical protein n=1 Tax=Pseudaminobacter soli (ex Li et al. 2025) TaxID=1295366 RepID=UPI002475FB03|nr:hypothetical protein [Mesorhizobium soli]MDH6233188.1 hypothetical protein [Mesorhizobium soli]
MKFVIYLFSASIAFIAGTIGSDIFARTSIAEKTVAQALNEALHWTWPDFTSTIMLAAPFFATALICAVFQRRARTRSTLVIFVVATTTLLYFYFNGYQNAQHALLEGKWTAGALTLGLLPFIGIPIVLAVAAAGAMVATFDRRPPAGPL